MQVSAITNRTAMIPVYIAGAIITYVFYRQIASSKKSKALQKLKHEEENAQLRTTYASLLPAIQAANSSFTLLTSYRQGYFSNYSLQQWMEAYVTLYNKIKEYPTQGIGLATTDSATIETFTDIYLTAEERRGKYNSAFVASELKVYDQFFSNVEGHSLDLQQRTAVITNEDNNIVIAGAGSGKTTTIVGKVNYVMDRYKARPEEILLISFTQKTALTLAERINIKGIEAKTFHKFGKDVITKVERLQPSIFSEAQFRPLLERFFNDELQKPAYLDLVTNYFTDLLKPYRSEFEFENQGEYIQYLKDQNVRPYKEVPNNLKGIKTIRLEIVKSMEECRIANFLYFNNINYEYEYPYEHQTATESYRQYKPDFKITHNGKVIYLEHYALNKNGDVPSWFTSEPEMTAREKYHQGITWKRELHAQHKTTVIETFSYQMQEGKLFENLYTQLIALGVTFKPKSSAEIWGIINQAANEEVKSLINLFSTFIALLKSNNYTFDQVAQKNTSLKPNEKLRNKAILEIITPLYERYQKHLQERGEIDFSDMINSASEYINERKFIQPYRYIIIDEFQDISIGRYRLIKAIKDQNPACRLFCVGDDWQSIYRFTGSDLTLFKDFSAHFGFSAASKIETTYRFSAPLIETSSAFIEKNPNQARKKLRSLGDKQTTLTIEYATGDESDDSKALQQIFDALSGVAGIEEKEILLLGRYSFDFARIKNYENTYIIDSGTQKVNYLTPAGINPSKKLTANFMTVHKAKGLEADIVIVLNCNSGKHGFPSQLSDDPALNLLLSTADQFPNGEERRLFYVAMTRAKQQLYLIAGENTKSKFIMELETGKLQKTAIKCPQCKTADMVIRTQGVARNGNKYKFYGCANYSYGCNHNHKIWENVGKN
jgi:DNA helicase-4